MIDRAMFRRILTQCGMESYVITDESLRLARAIYAAGKSVANGENVAYWATMKQLDELRGNLAESERDARRYRYLRDQQDGSSKNVFAGRDTGYGEGSPRLTGEQLDAAIDAAIADSTTLDPAT